MSVEYTQETCAKCGKANMVYHGDTSDLTRPDTDGFKCFACGAINRLPDEIDHPVTLTTEDEVLWMEDGKPVP